MRVGGLPAQQPEVSGKISAHPLGAVGILQRAGTDQPRVIEYTRLSKMNRIVELPHQNKRIMLEINPMIEQYVFLRWIPIEFVLSSLF
jgi:hypothetical protein